MNPSADRRRRRSQDPLIALHHQLTSAKAEQRIEAIVIADSAGMVMAAAGAWATCEEIAAYAPLIDRGLADASLSASDRLMTMSRGIHVRRVDVAGDTLLLCSRSEASEKAPGEAWFDRTAAGIRRILRAA